MVWTIKKFQGSSELTLRAKVTLSSIVNTASRKEVREVMGWPDPEILGHSLSVASAEAFDVGWS